MKKFRIILAIASLLCCLIALAACGGTALARPGRVHIDSDTLELSWNAVDRANRYVLEINGQELDIVIRENSYSLERLEPGEYTIRVKAADANGEYRDSEWSDSVSFVREEESGLSYRLTDGNTAYEVVGVGSVSGDVVMEDTYRGKPVTSIADGAFNSAGRLTGITIGNNVTEIGERAFYNCSGLVYVVMPDSVERASDSMRFRAAVR